MKKMLKASRPKGMTRFGGELMGLVSKTTHVMKALAYIIGSSSAGKRRSAPFMVKQAGLLPLLARPAAEQALATRPDRQKGATGSKILLDMVKLTPELPGVLQSHVEESRADSDEGDSGMTSSKAARKPLLDSSQDTVASEGDW